MNIGMLWFDNDKHSDVAQKVKRAAQFYQDKYGKKPAVCHLHPSLTVGGPVAGIVIEADSVIRPDYFWMGMDE